MRRFVIAAISVGLLVTAMVGAAAAAQPDDPGAFRWTEYGDEVFDLGCDFLIHEENVAHWMVTPNGNLVLQGFYTLSNDESGKSVTGNWVETWKNTSKGIQGNGLFWKATVPGYGVILIEAGYKLFDGPPDYPLLDQKGPSTFANTDDLAAFCDYLS